MPLFTHLLIDLHSLLTNALSSSKWPVTLIAICCFSILDCSALSIGPPLPSACLILPYPIYACDIYRFRLFSTSAADLHLPSATKLDCWLNCSYNYLLYMAAPLINLRYYIHLPCTQPWNLLYYLLYTSLHLINHWHCSSGVL